MSLSSFALVIGVLLYAFGFPLVFSDTKHVAWREKILQDTNILRVIAVFIIAIAATTLRRQWEISPDGEGVVIAIAWIALLKGVFIMFWPVKYAEFRGVVVEHVLDTPAMQMFAGFVLVLLGALFTYFGLVLA